MTDIRTLTGAINSLATGFINSQILFAANDANIFTLLESPRTAQDVAGVLCWPPRTTRMLLDGLVALELVEKADGRYCNAEVASVCLVPGKPAYQGNIVRHISNTAPLWSVLGEVLASGVPAKSFGEDRSPDALRSFILGMADIGKMSAREMLEALDLSPYSRMLDVGGGPGTYAITFLQAHPAMRATIFDRPEVLPIAREQVEAAGLAERFTYQPGDLTVDALGDGYDLILVSNIIHSYGPEKNRDLMGRCFRSLVSGGTLIVKDFLTDDDRSGPAFSLLFALRMLVSNGEGDTYSFGEVAEWTQEAGFTSGRLIDLSPQSRLWIAVKP
ncbi:MAG: methyltransferase domain-containing protein [Candidatus Hydrogenedentes bacterium]|nr:methyltransferase domain-containing protein [Candidatus Hydrogenedentota bacterium]